jgi:predicted RNase H-like nuclease
VPASLAVGADGARGGWLAALAHGTSPEAVERVELQLVTTFENLVALHGEGGNHGLPLAVDVPMGLPETGRPRPCDEQARALLGARGNAVFAPPSRPLLAATSYEEAQQLTAAAKLTDAAAKGLSAQAFAIAPKIREADEYLRAHPGAQAWLWECHPELSFRALAAGKVLRDKKSIGGHAERLRLMCDRFPHVLDALEAFAPSGRVADTSDALDALVALDTALHVLDDDYEELGGEKDATGLIMRMVF